MHILILPDLYFLFNDSYFFFLSLFFLIYFFSIIKTTKYIFILFPLFALIPLYIIYISIYQTAINEQILSIVLETNFQEAWSFIGHKIYWYIVIYIFWCIFCFYILYQSYKNPLIWEHRSRFWIIILGTLYFLTTYYLNAESDESQQDNFLVSEQNFFTQDLKKTYPLGFFISIYDLIKEQRKINTAFEKNQNFRFGIKAIKNSDKGIYILVIGETSRRENWQMNGYSRITNPLLSQKENLINFTNMLSLSNATRSSIPMILTRKPAEQVYHFNFPEKSIISAFKEAGFSTYWISTQQKFGAFDTSTSVYAREADHMLFLNKTGYSNQGDTDEVILPVLKQAIKSPENKKLIILHTLGSHYNYSHRYPKKFDIFKPSLNNIKNYSMQDKKYKNELKNSYDNSILYTDYFLNQIIEILKKEEGVSSFLFYTSDHGEDLFDNQCDKSGHGNTTIYNYEISSFTWYSDLYQKKNSEKIFWLDKNKNRKINQTSVFPTLVDAANLKIPNDRLKRSLLKKFADYPRFVNQVIDFDKKRPKGVCKKIQ